MARESVADLAKRAGFHLSWASYEKRWELRRHAQGYVVRYERDIEVLAPFIRAWAQHVR